MNKTPPTKEQMYQWYVEQNLTAVQIAEITGYNRSRVFYFLDLYCISRNKRTVQEIAPAVERQPVPDRPYELLQSTEGSTYRKIPGAEWLRVRYWDDNLSVTDIAKELNVNPNSVTKALHQYNIPIKPRYLCYEGKHTGRGDWSKSMRTRILKRDNFICRLCGSTDNLEVHHIVPLRLGGKTALNNGITLCSSCHDKVGFQESNHIGQFLQLLHKTE